MIIDEPNNENLGALNDCLHKLSDMGITTEYIAKCPKSRVSIRLDKGVRVEYWKNRLRIIMENKVFVYVVSFHRFDKKPFLLYLNNIQDMSRE